MVLCGFISAVGMYCFTQGYRVAPASTVAPFEYVMIGWSVLWGYVFWGDVPGPATLVGVAATVAAGVYVLQHQARAQRRAAPRPAPPRADGRGRVRGSLERQPRGACLK